MERTPHVLLVGAGAEAFAAKQGVRRLDAGALITDRMRAKWQAARAARAAPTGHGTVGCVARDAQGHVAAATSTGGTLLKLAGRVGDSAIVGAGTYADDRAGAASCTGQGEAFMKAAAAKLAVEAMLAGAPPDAAARQALAAVRRYGGDGGIICADVTGPGGVRLQHARRCRAPRSTRRASSRRACDGYGTICRAASAALERRREAGLVADAGLARVRRLLDRRIVRGLRATDVAALADVVALVVAVVVPLADRLTVESLVRRVAADERCSEKQRSNQALKASTHAAECARVLADGKARIAFAGRRAARSGVVRGCAGVTRAPLCLRRRPTGARSNKEQIMDRGDNGPSRREMVCGMATAVAAGVAASPAVAAEAKGDAAVQRRPRGCPTRSPRTPSRRSRGRRRTGPGCRAR